MFKKIIALILVFVTIFSCMVVPATATTGDAVDYMITNFWNVVSYRWDEVDGPFVYLKNLLSEFLADSDNPTADDLENAYDLYIENLYINYGTMIIDSDSLWTHTFTWDASDTTYIGVSKSNVISYSYENGMTVAFTGTSNEYTDTLRGTSEGVVIPKVGNYVWNCDVISLVGFNTAVNYNWLGCSTSSVYVQTVTETGSYSKSINFTSLATVRAYMNLRGINGANCLFSVSPMTLTYVGDYPVDDPIRDSNSRAASLTGLVYGYQDENGDTVIYAPEGSGMFNEEGGYVYNPITGETFQASDWTYNYDLMAYEITLSTGGSGTVTFGPDSTTVIVPDTVIVDGSTYDYSTYVENNTINEGDTINYVTYTYNYYYESSSGGSDIDDSEFVAWWKTQWTDFRTWLTSNWSSGSGNSSVPSDPADTTFPGSEDEEDGWSFLDLLVAVKNGAWTVTTGTVGSFFGGIGGVISSVVSVGDFYDAYDSGSPDNIFGITDYGGEDIWD